MRTPARRSTILQSGKRVGRDKTAYSYLKQLLDDPNNVASKAYRDPSITQQIINSLADKVQYSFYSQNTDSSGTERKYRYQDFEMMEFEPIVSSAIDIYADESTIFNEEDKLLQIKATSGKVKDELEDFFKNTVDIKNNAWTWARTLCKYGDYFVFIHTEEGKGITNMIPLPAVDIEKEHGYDEEHPEKIRYKWAIMQSAKRAMAPMIQTKDGKYIDDVNITHFCLDMDDKYFPYGKSVLDAGRRVWKQLNMLEDAMLVYRITRSPERRVFNIEVGNMSPKDIPDYIETVKNKLKKAPIVQNQSSGLMNLRYNPMAVDEDYFVASRGGVSSRIDTLPGAQNLGDIDDVQYMQAKLFAVLKVPKAYLSYEEDISAKSLLSQEDVRFSRTIERIQRVFLTGLTRMAVIHLFMKGFSPEDIESFDLKMTNPSHQAELMQLELWERRVAVFKEVTGKDQALSVETAMEMFLNLSKEEIRRELKRIQTNNHEELDGGEGGMFGEEAWDEAGPDVPEPAENNNQFGVPKEPTTEPMAFESSKTVFKDVICILEGEKKNA